MEKEQSAGDRVKVIFNTEMECGVTVKAGLEQLVTLLNTIQDTPIKPIDSTFIRNLKGHTRFVVAINDLLQKISGEKEGPITQAELAVAASFRDTLEETRANASCAYSKNWRDLPTKI